MRNRGISLTVRVVLATVFCVAALGQSTPTCTVNTDTVTPSCTGAGWLVQEGIMSDSAWVEELYFTGSSQVFSLLINGVVACNGVEDVTNADPPQETAIEDDMVGKCVSNH